MWALPNLKHNLWNLGQNPPRKYIIFYAQKNFSKKLFFQAKKNSILQKKSYIPSRERICPPSSRVSPFCHSAKPYRQGNTRLSHIKRRRLIMPLVALVQKKQSAPATAYKFWCSALPSSSPLLLAFRHATSECLYKNAPNKPYVI